MPKSSRSEISLPKNVEIFIRIAAVFVSVTVVLAPLQDGETFVEQLLQVLPLTVPALVLVVICTIAFLRWRSNKSATSAPEVDYGEHPPLN